MTFEEVAEEFACPENRVRRIASDEGWSALRAAHMETRLRESDATVALLKAVKMDTAIMHEMADVAVEVFSMIRGVLTDPKLAKKAASTRANVANTLSFALSNLSNACARVGIVGLPKSLKEAAEGSNGRWNAGMLASLNVTVQNIMGPPAQPAAAPERVQELAVDRSVTTVDEPAALTGGQPPALSPEDGARAAPAPAGPSNLDPTTPPPSVPQSNSPP